MTGELLRTGRKVGRTIYVQHGLDPADDDPLIGIMDTEVLASRVVDAVNGAALHTVQELNEAREQGRAEGRKRGSVNAAAPVAREDTASPDATTTERQPDPECGNCDGRGCMGCVFRAHDHDCENDCPTCCQQPYGLAADRLRVGRKVGRTIYAQMGDEPSDDDPLVGLMDTEKLAGTVVDAVNGSARHTLQQLREAYERGLADAREPNPSDPGDGSGVDTTTRATAVDTQSADPIRDALVKAFRSHDVIYTDDSIGWTYAGTGEAERMADVALGVLRDAELRGPSLDEPATARLGDVPTTLRWVSAVVKADLSMAEGEQEADEHRALLRRIAGAQVAVYDALGVLRGGGADGSGEDEGYRYDSPISDEEAAKWASCSRNEAIRQAEDSHREVLAKLDTIDRMHAERGHRIDGLRKVLALPEEWSSGEVLDAARVWIEANVKKEPAEREPREPSGQCDVCSAPLYNVCTRLDDGGKACSARCVDLHRLARAAGVSPDSEDVVGAIEAAIRAGRERWVVGGEYARTSLPAGSWVATLDDDGTVQLDADGKPWPLHRAEHLGNTPRTRGRSFVVVYRAPAPAPAPLTVGDEVKTPEQLAALPEHTVLRDASFDICERVRDRWKCLTGTDHVDLPARILDLLGSENA